MESPDENIIIDEEIVIETLLDGKRKRGLVLPYDLSRSERKQILLKEEAFVQTSSLFVKSVLTIAIYLWTVALIYMWS
jgi:hypothetical protein